MNLLSKKQTSQPNDLFYTNNMLLSGSYIEDGKSANNLIEFYDSYIEGEKRNDKVRELHINVSDNLICFKVKMFSSTDFSCKDLTFETSQYFDITSDIEYDSDNNFFKFKTKLRMETLTPKCFDMVRALKTENAYNISDWLLNKEIETTNLNYNGQKTNTSQHIMYWVISPLIGNRIYTAINSETYADHPNPLNEYIKY